MIDTTISNETAKLAQRKKYPIRFDVVEGYDGKKRLLQLTQSRLQKWLREDHNIHLTVKYSPHDHMYYYYINFYGNQGWDECTDGEFYETYEEALEMGLKRSLLRVRV